MLGRHADAVATGLFDEEVLFAEALFGRADADLFVALRRLEVGDDERRLLDVGQAAFESFGQLSLFGEHLSLLAQQLDLAFFDDVHPVDSLVPVDDRFADAEGFLFHVQRDHLQDALVTLRQVVRAAQQVDVVGLVADVADDFLGQQQVRRSRLDRGQRSESLWWPRPSLCAAGLSFRRSARGRRTRLRSCRGC